MEGVEEGNNKSEQTTFRTRLDTCYGRIRFNDQNHKENQIERGGLNPGGSSGLSWSKGSNRPVL